MFKDLPKEDEQLEHLLAIDRFMTGHGFEHYEISNFARPGYRAKHNLAYWTGQSYLGLGPSAHSFDREKSKRWKNFSSLHKYGEKIARGESVVEWEETLTDDQKGLEKWMLALRLEEGFPVAWLDTASKLVKSQLFQKEGLLETHPKVPSNLRLTPRGFALSDQVISALAT